VTVLAAAAAAQTGNPGEPPFTGFHVGGYVGGTFSRPVTTMSATDTGSYFAASSVTQFNAAGVQRPDGTAFSGGGTFGYDYQGENNWLFGFEVDFGVMKLEEVVTSGPIEYTCCAGSFFDITQGVKTDWLFTARPRIGYVSGNWMPYFTGGVALTNIEYEGVFTDDFAGGAFESGAMKEKRAGWTVGGGVEYKFNQHWSVKGEYLYTDFGDDSFVSTNMTTFGGTPTPDEPITHQVEMRTHAARFGFSFWF
jgi:outer membrane immunogenic protein